MHLTRFLFVPLLAFALLQVPARADLSAQTLADLKSTDPLVRSAALRLRALDFEKQGRYEAAKNDFIECLAETRKTDNRGREAEMFARIAGCQVYLGAFNDASANMEKAPRQKGWIEDDRFFLTKRALVYVATDQHQKALEIAQRLKDSTDESSKTMGTHYEACTRYLMGEKASLELLMGPQLYDPEQLPFNRAISLNPRSYEARVKRARYFARRAGQKRFPDYYPATVPTSKGGWMNLIDTNQLSVQPHTFYQSAYYDWSRAIELEKHPADYAERALMAAMWNEVAPVGANVISVSSIQSDLKAAENNGPRDPETRRALGRFYENTLPKGETATLRPVLRQAISNYSMALVYAPSAPENTGVREARNNLIGMFLSAKPVAPPATKPTTAEQWKLRGNELATKGENSAALTAYQKALEVDPKYADAMNNIGKQYVEVGAYDLALEWFSKAIAADPKHRIAYYDRASVNRDLGEVDLALKDASSAIQFAVTEAQKTEALSLRSALYYATGNNEKASDDLATALEVTPGMASIWAMEGQVKLENGNLADAVEAFGQAKRLEPKNVRFAALLAVVSLLKDGTAPSALDLSKADRNWLVSLLKKPKLDELYAKSPQKERLGQARKWANATD